MIQSAQSHIALIRDSLTQIERYRPSSRGELERQSMAQDAILMRLHVMGESLASIRRLDEDAFDGVAQDSWYKLIGLRNIISHGYDIIDYDIIWQIVTEELPPFADSIEQAAELLP